MTEPNTTAADWAKAEFTLELGADLLPIVPAGTEPSPYSKVKKFGKTPSDFGPHGARGIAGWQSMEITPSDLQRWAAEPRYSMCVRASAVRAIDVDVTDPALAIDVDKTICDVLGMLMPKRVRSNSSKFLIPFRLKAPLPKRIIRCANKQIIEFLADGQQWLICGAHESGVRYEWQLGFSDYSHRLPDDIPELQLDQFEALWLALSTKFAVSTDPTDVTVRKDATDAPERPGEVLTAIPDEVTYNKLRDALAWPALREAADENSIWAEIGYALLSIPEGNRLWLAFERGGGPHENRPQDWWNAHRTQTPRSDWRHIFTLARRYGWGREPPPASAFPIVPVEPGQDQVPGTPIDLLPPIPDKPIIKLQGGELESVALQCEQIIDAYSQGEFLVRFGKVRDDGYLRDPHAQPLVRATMEWIRLELTSKATILKFDGRSNKFVVSDCPKELAQLIVSQRHWTKIRALEAVARAPFMRTDGSICTQPGYDPQSRVMYIRSIDFPAIPENPTRADALKALDTLLAPFDQFPMSSKASKSAFAAHILTEVARTAMQTSPMFWYSATTAGTGKTLLSEMASLIAHGESPAAKPWVGDGEEMRKALFAALLAGDHAIRFDNLTNGLKFRSPNLCVFLTAPLYSDRKLGVSESPTMPNRTVVIATGNNVTPAGDLARRSLVIRMDANLSARKMRERSFKIDDIHGYVQANRAELLIAALTVLRAHQQSGFKSPVAPMQSFIEWSKLVRDALIWLDLGDPLASQEEETDDEASLSLDQLFAKLFEVTEGKPFYAMSLVGSNTELLQALLDAGCDGNDAKKIGYWLSARRGVIAGDYKLTDGKKTMRGIPWQLVPQSGAFGDLL